MKSKLIVGLMSGTSLDGIDAVLLRVHGHGATTRFTQLAFVEKQFPQGLKTLLLKNSNPGTSSVDDIARLNFLLAELYAEAVGSVTQRARVKISKVDLIGSHGQTIRHLPKPHRMFGKPIRSTLQIGDPSVLATLTGICTVGDFRVADMAAGGQGAPLVPYFDWLAFRSKTRNRLLLNIGGIANMTVLPRNCTPDQVYAFDTGPGNMVVDTLMHEFYGKPYDDSGETASRGAVSLDLFDQMIRHPYLKQKLPKSTGREEFGREFAEQFISRAKRYDREDIIATASQFTAFAVYEGYKRFVQKKMRADEVIVSGGGSKNRFFLDELRRYFAGAGVRLIDELGVSSDAKEAICFALLANETMAGITTNMPSVTGAKRKVVLGKICRP
ncbi:MAG: anhydro-N-acetylmuramic acid kinase [Ignavibacteriae bacterium]|nr:anhydro-N-acetylmuramic acid kinase [Ignavibacteriota bacterium]